jgi:hypothetical protein
MAVDRRNATKVSWRVRQRWRTSMLIRAELAGDLLGSLQSLDADALDDAAGAWAQQRIAPRPGGRRLIAVDGKTLRGSAAAGRPARHLLAALDHGRRRGPGTGRRSGQEPALPPCERASTLDGRCQRSLVPVPRRPMRFDPIAAD